MCYTGGKVREIRRELKLSQADLAERIGITKDKLSRRERGEFKFQLIEAYRISKIFGKSIESIFFTK